MESPSLVEIFKKPNYLILCLLFIISLILTTLIFIYSKRNTIKDSFIFKVIMNLLIITTLHSFAYIIYYYTETNLSVTNSPLCWIQSILLISSCQTQEVWLMIITFVCYQGIINRTFYNMQNDLSLFIVFVIMINFVYPLSLILIYYCSDALGPFETYCWVKSGLKTHMVILYVLKFLYIILNLLMTIRLLFKVNKMDKSKEENRNEITFCKKDNSISYYSDYSKCCCCNM